MDCEWTYWESSPCSASCGYGTITKTRKKVYTQRKPNFYDRNHHDQHYDIHHKHYDHIPDNHYQHNGYGKRSTYHHAVGKECHGESTKTESCHLTPCPSMY